MPAPSRYDVVVVGAGVIGAACAWSLAERGLAVALVDPDPGQGASYAAAGMLAPVTELHYGEEELLALNLAAARRYPSFVAALEQACGAQVGYRTCGTLAVALDAGDRAVLEDLRRFQQSLGLEVRSLTGPQCRQLEPMLAPGVRGGVMVAGDHQVDSRRLVDGLRRAAARSGAVEVRQRAGSLLTRAGAAAGVALADGSTLEAAMVLLAAGWQSADLPGVPDDAVPSVRPVKGQVLRLSVPASRRPFLSRTLRGTVRGLPVYLVPREDGELVVGATVEELGPDQQVTAGGVYELLREAHALVPGITELALVETTARLRPGTADNAPLVGTTSLPGLVVATGHYRNGVLLAPVTADAVTRLVLDGEPTPELAPFGPRRAGPGRAGLAGSPHTAAQILTADSGGQG